MTKQNYAPRKKSIQLAWTKKSSCAGILIRIRYIIFNFQVLKKNFFFTCLCVNLNCRLEKYTGCIDIVCALRNIECWWQSICLWTRNCVTWYASDKFNFRLSPRYIGCLFLEHTELYACFPQTTNTCKIECMHAVIMNL